MAGPQVRLKAVDLPKARTNARPKFVRSRAALETDYDGQKFGGESMVKIPGKTIFRHLPDAASELSVKHTEWARFRDVSDSAGTSSRAIEQIYSKRRQLLLAAAATVVPRFGMAAQPDKVSRVAFLSATTPQRHAPNIEALRSGLRALGYIEGQNIAIECRWAEDKRDRLPTLAAELVELQPDVIVTGGSKAIRAVKKETTTIPIVMAVVGDPVARFKTGLPSRTPGRRGGRPPGRGGCRPGRPWRKSHRVHVFLPRT